MKRTLVFLLSAVLVGAIAGAPAQAKPKKGPMVVGTDDTGDWGANVDPTIAPLGAQLGMDLEEASIAMADPSTVNFIIKVTGLPPTGGVPESARYNWDFFVDDQAFQMTGAFTEYLRGVCNPNVTNSCPPPRDPGSAPFFIRQGSCLVGQPCEEVGLVHATFDAAAGTITIPVGIDILEAHPGSKIAPGTSSLGGTVYAATAAFVTQAALPSDIMTLTKTFRIPKCKGNCITLEIVNERKPI